jgi:hypothetical protein
VVVLGLGVVLEVELGLVVRMGADVGVPGDAAGLGVGILGVDDGVGVGVVAQALSRMLRLIAIRG